MALIHAGENRRNSSSTATTSPTTPANEIPSDYALSALRAGALRARLIATEADTIGIALLHGFVSPEGALLWARDAGIIDLVGQDDFEDEAASLSEEA